MRGASRLTSLPRGLTPQLEQDADQWLIWVREEDSLEPARELYQQFRDRTGS